MEDELIAKISRRLEAGIATEEDVIYLMVKIRKLLERKNLKAEYPVLLFYCDWSLHASMDRGGAREMLRLVDGYLSGRRPRAVSELTRLLGLPILRSEMCRFLANFGVSDQVIRDEEAWLNFREKFVANIADCALVAPDGMGVRCLSFVERYVGPENRGQVHVRIDLADTSLDLAIE
jgi:hypothetical protein